MKRKIKGSLILAAVGLLAAGAAGFYYGFDIGQTTNDQTRIEKELSRVDLDEDISLNPVARSATGKMELRVIGDYLDELKNQAGNLQNCNDRLKELAGGSAQDASIFEITGLMNISINSYSRIKDITDKPEQFISQRLAEYDASHYSAWVEDWCDDLKTVSGYDGHFNGRMEELHEENMEYMGQLSGGE